MKRQLPRTPMGRDDVELLGSETLFDGPRKIVRLQLRHHTYSGGWSEELMREVFQVGDTVAVLPYDPSADSVLVIEQFRAPAYLRGDAPWLVEPIAGRIEAEEAPETTVHREAQEEAHCRLSNLEPVASVYTTPGLATELKHHFVAQTKISRQVTLAGSKSEDEDIRVIVLPVTDFLAALDSGAICDASLTLLGHWFARHYPRLRAAWSAKR